MKIGKAGILIGLISLLFLSACSGKETNAVKNNGTSSEQKSSPEAKPRDPAPDVVKEDVDLSSFFDGINGCAVLYRPEENSYSLYNSNLCEQEVSPYSTFKIISTLAGLENGVIKDETSTMNYNGSQYAVPEWNGNLALEDAFKSSCVWYFRQIIDVVGVDEMSAELEALQYGNCDISEWNGSGINPQKELNGFWLDSSLKIAPLEQVNVLSKIFEGHSTFSEENVTILQHIMLVDESDSQKIYGKTGSGSDGNAWFVGFKEKDNVKEYFAVYLSDESRKDMINGNTAKEIALKIME